MNERQDLLQWQARIYAMQLRSETNDALEVAEYHGEPDSVSMVNARFDEYGEMAEFERDELKGE